MKKQLLLWKRFLTSVLLLVVAAGFLEVPAYANSRSKVHDYADWVEFDREIIEVDWASYLAYPDDVISLEKVTFYRPVVYVPVGTTVKLKSGKTAENYRITDALTTPITNNVEDFVRNKSYNEITIQSAGRVMYGIYQYIDDIPGKLAVYVSGSASHIACEYTMYIVGIDEAVLSSKSVERFDDVKPTDFYYAPVAWALENEITDGLSKVKFGPDRNCSKAEILTFLWRAAGSPEPTIGNPYTTGLTADDYYYKAALWAYEKGIDTGMSTNPSHFDGEVACRRLTVVAYLWRFAGCPVPHTTVNFSDMINNDVYTQIVSWAVQEGITSGTSSDTFSPSDACSRGEILTFLYRYFVK